MKNVFCVTLLSHLIYLDLFFFPGKKKTSEERKFPFPKFSSYFWCIQPPHPDVLREGSGELTPTPEAHGERDCVSLGAQAPPRDVKLINSTMVVSSLMFLFAKSQL